MTTAQYNAALLPICTQAIQQAQPSMHLDSTLSQVPNPVRICEKLAGQGTFKLQLALHRNRPGEVAAALRSLNLLDKLLGPLVGQQLQIEVLEYSYGQYAQFALEVDTRRELFRVMKTMNGQTWSLCTSESLSEALQFVQDCVYQTDDDNVRQSNR